MDYMQRLRLTPDKHCEHANYQVYRLSGLSAGKHTDPALVCSIISFSISLSFNMLLITE